MTSSVEPRSGFAGRHGSDRVTEGVRVVVSPRYAPNQSDPDRPVYVFSYRVRIANEGPGPVTLRSRRWVIVDAAGRAEEVEGEGVVGRQPRLEPGQVHEYESYCPLRTPWGTMEGVYRMERDDGSSFDAAIGRFFLVVPRGGAEV